MDGKDIGSAIQPELKRYHNQHESARPTSKWRPQKKLFIFEHKIFCFSFSSFQLSITSGKISFLNCSNKLLKVFSVEARSDIVSLTDETRKYGKCIQTYVLTDETQTSYILGLREMFNKSGQSTLDTFKDILNDINDHCYQAEKKCSVFFSL
jgi:hypothetical protein